MDHPRLGGCFIYRVPEGWEPEAGDLLSVPFGQQVAGAVALGWRAELPAGVEPQSVRTIEAVVAKGILPKEFWPLLQRVADYYLTPWRRWCARSCPLACLAAPSDGSA